MTVQVLPFSEQVRSATMDLLRGAVSGAGIKAQLYRGRPTSINPPAAFIDLFHETFDDYTGVIWAARHVRVEVLVLFGEFDGGETVDQRDRFVDKFYEYALPLFHAAGGNSTFALVEVQDDPTYVPDWIAPANQRTYFATRMSMEAFARG